MQHCFSAVKTSFPWLMQLHTNPVSLRLPLRTKKSHKLLSCLPSSWPVPPIRRVLPIAMAAGGCRWPTRPRPPFPFVPTNKIYSRIKCGALTKSALVDPGQHLSWSSVWELGIIPLPHFSHLKSFPRQGRSFPHLQSFQKRLNLHLFATTYSYKSRVKVLLGEQDPGVSQMALRREQRCHPR